MKNPIQPIENHRFKQNKIVRDLLDFASKHGMGLNEIACGEYSNDDRQQLAQLIGYSLSGYSELSYVDDDSYNAAEQMAEGKNENQARIDSLETELAAVRDGLRPAIARLYGVHPDDLNNMPY